MAGEWGGRASSSDRARGWRRWVADRCGRQSIGQSGAQEEADRTATLGTWGSLSPSLPRGQAGWRLQPSSVTLKKDGERWGRGCPGTHGSSSLTAAGVQFWHKDSGPRGSCLSASLPSRPCPRQPFPQLAPAGLPRGTRARHARASRAARAGTEPLLCLLVASSGRSTQFPRGPCGMHPLLASPSSLSLVLV